MNLAHIVLLLAVTIAVVAIAGYLIAIVLILRRVVNRLDTILGGVEGVTKTSQPVDALVRDINADLDAGRRTLEDFVARLEDSRAPVGAGDGSARRTPDRHATGGGVGTGTAAPPPGPPAPPGESDSSQWPPPGRPSPPPGPLWDR